MALFKKKKPKNEAEEKLFRVSERVNQIFGKGFGTSDYFRYLCFQNGIINSSGFAKGNSLSVKMIINRELLNQKLSADKIEERTNQLLQMDYETILDKIYYKEDTSIYLTQNDLNKKFGKKYAEKFSKTLEEQEKEVKKYHERQEQEKNKNISKNDSYREIRRVVDGYYFKYKIAYYGLDKNELKDIKTLLESELEDDRLSIENIESRANNLLDEKINNFVDEGKDEELGFLDEEIKEYDFKCSIDEKRTNWVGEKIVERRDCFVNVLDDKLTIKKTGVFIKSDLGTRTIHYSDITGVDFDKAGKFHITNSIQLIIKGGEHITLIHISERDYNLINNKWEEYKAKTNNAQTSQSSEPNNNSADELMKYAELYEKGLLSEEEFAAMKKKLLGL